MTSIYTSKQKHQEFCNVSKFPLEFVAMKMRKKINKWLLYIKKNA